MNYGNNGFAGDFPPYYILHMIVCGRNYAFLKTVVVTQDAIGNFRCFKEINNYLLSTKKKNMQSSCTLLHIYVVYIIYIYTVYVFHIKYKNHRITEC